MHHIRPRPRRTDVSILTFTLGAYFNWRFSVNKIQADASLSICLSFLCLFYRLYTIEDWILIIERDALSILDYSRCKVSELFFTGKGICRKITWGLLTAHMMSAKSTRGFDEIHTWTSANPHENFCKSTRDVFQGSLSRLFPQKVTEKIFSLKKNWGKCFANWNKSVTLHRKTTKKYKYDDN